MLSRRGGGSPGEHFSVGGSGGSHRPVWEGRSYIPIVNAYFVYLISYLLKTEFQTTDAYEGLMDMETGWWQRWTTIRPLVAPTPIELTQLIMCPTRLALCKTLNGVSKPIIYYPDYNFLDFRKKYKKSFIRKKSFGFPLLAGWQARTRRRSRLNKPAPLFHLPPLDFSDTDRYWGQGIGLNSH